MPNDYRILVQMPVMCLWAPTIIFVMSLGGGGGGKSKKKKDLALTQKKSPIRKKKYENGNLIDYS